MGMAEDDGSDRPDALAPQKRRDHVLPDVERSHGQSAAVDDHLLPAREFDQNGIPVPHIQERQAKDRRSDGIGIESQQQEECGEGGRRHRLLGPVSSRNEKDQEGDPVSDGDPQGRGRNPEGQPRLSLQKARGPQKDVGQKPQPGRADAQDAPAQIGQGQEKVAGGQKNGGDRDSQKVEKQAAERDPVEGRGDQRQHARLGRQRHGQGLRNLQGKPRQAARKRLEEEEDEQGRRIGQGEAHVEDLERIVQQDDESAQRQRVEQMDVLP